MSTRLQQLTQERQDQLQHLRSLVRSGNLDALRRYLPEVDRLEMWTELSEDLNAWLENAYADNNRGDMSTVVQMAALIGDQDLLLKAQSHLIPEREILLEDDSALMGLVTESFDMSTATKGARGIGDAGTPEFIGKPGELAEPWDGMGLLPDEADEVEGPSQAEFGRGTRSVTEEYGKWAGPRKDAEE